MVAKRQAKELHPYWNAWALVDDARRAGQPAVAAQALRHGARLMEAEILAAEEDIRTVPKYVHTVESNWVDESTRLTFDYRGRPYPLLEREAFAWAAASQDQEALDILDKLCVVFGREESTPCGADYLRIVAKVLAIVSMSEVTHIKEVRSVFSPEDRIRLRTVWRVMQDFGALVVEKRGTAIFFHRELPAAAEKQQTQPVAFRKGQRIAEPILISSPVKLAKGRAGQEKTEGNPYEYFPIAVPSETPLPKERRRTRKHGVLSAGDKTWLFDIGSTRPDGSVDIPIEVLHADGSVGPSLALEPGGFDSDSQRNCVTSVSEDGVVNVYTPDGDLVLSLDMRFASELKRTVRRYNQRELAKDDYSTMSLSGAIRSVHVSIEFQTIAIAVLDEVFVYSFGGQVLAAFRFDSNRTMETLHGTVSTPHERGDWAEYVRLAKDGQRLFISTYWELLLSVSLTGVLIDHWILGEPVSHLRETPGGIVGATRTDFYSARPGGNVILSPLDGYGDLTIVGQYGVLESKAGSAIFDMEVFQGRQTLLPKPRRAAFLVHGKLVIDTNTSRYEF